MPVDDKYIQHPPGQSAKGGSWEYDATGRLISVNGEKVPKSVKVYHPDFQTPTANDAKEGVE